MSHIHTHVHSVTHSHTLTCAVSHNHTHTHMCTVSHIHTHSHVHRYTDKESTKKLQSKQRERMQPKTGRMDIDYQVRAVECVGCSFFIWQLVGHVYVMVLVVDYQVS